MGVKPIWFGVGIVTGVKPIWFGVGCHLGDEVYFVWSGESFGG